MARAVKEEEHAEKRNAILDAAQQLIYTKGYEQMTIQDILDALRISKGAFYHYFGSKQDLMDALIERMIEEAIGILHPIAYDPHLPALEKFQRVFTTLNRWKTAQKGFLMQILRAWYGDDNAIVREKLMTQALKQITSLLGVIIHQGIEEGVMAVSYPDQVSSILLILAMGMGDTLGRLLLTKGPGGDSLLNAERLVATANEAVERILNAPAGSVHFTNPETLREWFSTPGEV
jgi:AcrR family transcriptional regulator